MGQINDELKNAGSLNQEITLILPEQQIGLLKNVEESLAISDVTPQQQTPTHHSLS